MTPSLSRRDMLRATLGGFGYLAFSGLSARAAIHDPHFVPKAKRVRVALKILPPRKAAAEPRTRARFLREVAIGRELPTAENIAHVYETGIADGVAFIAMEYVPGRTVKSIVTASDSAR